MTKMISKDKIIYLITTYKCSACKCMEYLLKEKQADNPRFELKIIDFNDTPEWLKVNVVLTDFPTIVLIKDGIIKYQFVGTRSSRKLDKLFDDLEF